MRDVLTILAPLMIDAADWLRSTAEGARETLEGGTAVSRVLGVVFELLGFLGPLGLVLFFVSLLLLAFLGSFSPLPKLVNYLVIVALVTAAALMGMSGLGDIGSLTDGVARYLAFMLLPVALVFGVKRMFRRPDKTEKLQNAVEELTEQVAMLRRETELAPVREQLTIEAAGRRVPSRLVRRIGR